MPGGQDKAVVVSGAGTALAGAGGKAQRLPSCTALESLTVPWARGPPCPGYVQPGWTHLGTRQLCWLQLGQEGIQLGS